MPSLPSNDVGFPLLRTWRQGSIHFTWTDEGIVTRSFLDNRHDARREQPCRDARAAAMSPLRQRPCRRCPFHGRRAALDRLHGIRAGGDRLSRPGGHRVRGLGADRTPSIDRFRRFSGRGRGRTASKNVQANPSRFERPTEPGWRAVGCPPRGRSSRDGPRSYFTGLPKPRRRSRHDAPRP